MIEAAFAAAYAEYFQIQDYVRFDDLGAYSVLLPFCRTRTMRDFSDRVLEPVIVYDMENKSHLEETLSAYCENRHDLHRAAEAMGQHANTIRYRLQRISDLSGRDYRDPLQMEELDMAYRIRRSWEILDMLGLPETVRRP
jgi:DNA-binding PucR family transcriptional regulator